MKKFSDNCYIVKLSEVAKHSYCLSPRKLIAEIEKEKKEVGNGI